MTRLSDDKIHIDTVGMPIRLILLDDGEVHDPTGASVLKITITKPDGTTEEKTDPDVSVGTAEDGRACLEYTTVAGDLATVGPYKFSGYVEDGAGKWPAEPVSVRVWDWP